MITTRQIKAARALLAWTAGDLAHRCGVPYASIVRLESVDGRLRGRAAAAATVVATLEAAGVIFIEANGEGPGVRLRKTK
jgi:hypothetical protein